MKFAAALLVANVSADALCELSFDLAKPYSYNDGCGFCDWKQLCNTHEYCSSCCTTNGELKWNQDMNCRARITDENAKPLAASNVNQIEQFVAGLLKGLIQKDELNNIQHCLKDATTLDQELQTAIQDFEKKDIPDIIAAVKVIGQMVQSLNTDLSDCKGMSADLQRIEKWAAIFKNPKQLAETLLKNTIEHIMPIHSDITKISADAKSQNYEDLGETVADLMVQELGPVPQLSKEEMDPRLLEALEITEGVLKGAVDAEGLTNIQDCMNDAGPIITDVETAIADFKKKTAPGIIDGMKHMASAVKEMQAEVQTCKGVKADWEKLEKMVKTFDNPASFVYHVGHDIVVNGQDIFKEVEGAVQQYDNKSWEPMGEDIGEALAKLILGDAQEQQDALNLY